MEERKLTLKIPREIAVAIVRRHKGREDISAEEAREAYAKMTFLHTAWQKARKHLHWVLNDFWDGERIEAHYGTPKFYGAHRRLANARKRVRELHADMFYLLVCNDGNYEPFSEHHSIDAESIYADFISKYKKYL